jgi:hypothetical protein
MESSARDNCAAPIQSCASPVACDQIGFDTLFKCCIDAISA